MSIVSAQRAMHDGRFQDARDLLRKVLRAGDDSPEIRFNLAMVMTRLGEFAGASEHFRHCLKAAPDNVELLNNLGNAERLCGQLDHARKHLDRALELDPGHVGARCNRGWLMLRLGQSREATIDFKTVIEKTNKVAEAWRGLGDSLAALGQLEQANDTLGRGIGHCPDSAALHNSRGVVFVKQRRPELAIDCFERALKMAPRHADALINHGITCEQLGRLAEAESSLMLALEVQPGSPTAHFHLAQLAEHRPTTAEIASIEQALTEHPGDEAAINLEFALGKSLAKNGRHDAAFPNFLAARRRLARTQPYSLSADLQKFSEIMAAHQHTATGEETTRYVFVVGMPRSGTTLVDRIVASHPQVSTFGESGATAELLARYNTIAPGNYPAGFTSLSTTQKKLLADPIRGALTPREKDRVSLDTSPANFPYLGLLADLLPDARFVNCTRSPLDTCVSIFEHPLSKSHAYANELADLAAFYRAYENVTNHWKATLGPRLYTVAYESLLANPREEVTRLLAHCGLGFDSACLRFHETGGPVQTPSASQVRQPLHNKSVGRWKHYEKFLGPLLDEFGDQ